MESPIKYFKKLKDPRVERTKRHHMDALIFITIASVICGAQTWEDIANYGKKKELWLKQYLRLPNGIPSHDTFNRFFSMLDPKQLEECFLEWIKSVAQLTQGEVVSIDGKTLRGTMTRGDKSFVHMVSAWASVNNMVLGQVKVDDKSNEITAIPKLLEVLELNGCIVTIDAMGCQTDIAREIVRKGADYILAVKGNQPRLEEDIKTVVNETKPSSQSEHTERGHGRVEKRSCFVYDNLSVMETKERWADLASVVKIVSERYVEATDKHETETRLYIASFLGEAKNMSQNIRSHWGIENKLHWSLDVSFNEDQSRKRAGFSAQNFSTIVRIALNLLKNDKTQKRSIRGKRLDAAWDNNYLLHILKN
ncbi:MAG: ISAs1 family transposase [Opitutaceae bacterium]|jgi:predicted transposase YbfD/YdcC|nr:ISAs1 family transposase [Opitutaceae bacterium]